MDVETIIFSLAIILTVYCGLIYILFAPVRASIALISAILFAISLVQGNELLMQASSLGITFSFVNLITYAVALNIITKKPAYIYFATFISVMIVVFNYCVFF